MEYAVEHKVQHNEWDEAKISAVDFFKLYALAFEEDDNGDSRLSDWHYMPTLHFENGDVSADEMWGAREGRVYTSSGQSGVMGWDAEKEQYTKHVYFRETELGQFQSATFWLDDDLKAVLDSIK